MINYNRDLLEVTLNWQAPSQDLILTVYHLAGKAQNFICIKELLHDLNNSASIWRLSSS